MRIPNMLPSTQVSEWMTGGAKTITVPGRPLPTGPESITDLIGYWDARDVASGSVTTWSPRSSNGAIGDMTGTGTRTADRIDTPKFSTTTSLNTAAGMTTTTEKAFFFVGMVTSLGSDTQSRYLVHVAAPTTATGGGHGLLWYNYLGNVTKLVCNTADVSAGGIAQKSINVRYLWIANYPTGCTTATCHTYTETGTSTAMSIPTYATTSVLHVGKRGDNGANVALVGNVCAVGVYSKQLDSAAIQRLRDWANLEFGVVA